MDIGPWLDRIFPEVAPDPRPENPSWVARIKTRTPEHNPPLFWLGRALDIVEEHGALEAFAARARAAIVSPRRATWESEQAIEDVFSEACAFAWAAEHLGRPEFIEEPGGTMCIAVPDHDAVIAARRLHPQERLEDVLETVARLAIDAAADLPTAAGRILYVDTYLNLRFYAQDVGYRLELTEPVIAAMRQFAGERDLGHVLTRPFQWGNPVDAAY
ncbi:MAG: hypothetical protein O3A10_04655 [Chloroflexi bacterium]|nr:hypothetical protein [Chloroflexota bacterium]MDA1145570.1 hypothetical protein [Chloroflexota bacterium]